MLILTKMENQRKLTNTIAGELRCESCGKILAVIEEEILEENIAAKDSFAINFHMCPSSCDDGDEDIRF